MPLKFWDEEFLTATYLINLLPSKVIKFETPITRLFGITPDYKSLREFGCACWPNLRPYNARKLAFRSKKCVFLGYSPIHKGVKCLDVSTGRVYISRDVVFDESVYPFESLHPNAGALLKKYFFSHHISKTVIMGAIIVLTQLMILLAGLCLLMCRTMQQKPVQKSVQKMITIL